MYVFGMGESHSIDDLLYSEDHYADPYPLWERMRHEAPVFYEAEDYHQDYYRKNPNQGYCTFVIKPKLKKLNLE